MFCEYKKLHYVCFIIEAGHVYLRAQLKEIRNPMGEGACPTSSGFVIYGLPASPGPCSFRDRSRPETRAVTPVKWSPRFSMTCSQGPAKTSVYGKPQANARCRELQIILSIGGRGYDLLFLTSLSAVVS